ncbi:MAG: LeuD/DmdB family oxidoreductase small subunit [Promethearchaeota archaeon]
MRGKVIKYEQANINTDLIIPARYLVKFDPKFLATHCMEDLDPLFHQKRENLGAEILIAGPNFGSGSSREQAPLALKHSGIKCVIAPFFARIFLRNSINIGLSILEFKKIDELNEGDDLEIDFQAGVLKNITTGQSYSVTKMQKFLEEIINAGGLMKYGKKLLKEMNG